jgi:suppressor of G2 allele of SKP1
MAIAETIVLVEKYLDEDKITEAEKELAKLNIDPEKSSFKILILQAQVFLRKKQLVEAKEYANRAFKLAFQNGKRNEIAKSLNVLALSYFREKNYDEAFKYILHAVSYDDSTVNSEIKMFKNVVNLKYKKHFNLNDTELKEVENKILSTNIKPNLHLENDDKSPTTTSSELTAKSIISEPTKQKQNMRFDWFDSSKSVEISIYIKKINSESIISDIQSNSINFKFKDSDNFEYDFKIDQLFDNININESSYKVFGTKMTIILIKKNNCVWTDIKNVGNNNNKSKNNNNNNNNNTNNENNNKINETSGSTAYPSSSTKKIDWSKFEIEDENDEENDDPDGFFKKLYGDADENTKRAMMKSFIESNGTSLSTDWSDVGSREVKPYGEGDDNK